MPLRLSLQYPAIVEGSKMGTEGEITNQAEIELRSGFKRVAVTGTWGSNITLQHPHTSSSKFLISLTPATIALRRRRRSSFFIVNDVISALRYTSLPLFVFSQRFRSRFPILSLSPSQVRAAASHNAPPIPTRPLLQYELAFGKGGLD